MILTLFYMASASWNAYKLRSIYLKLKQAAEKSSIVFYKIPHESSLALTTSPSVASDLCKNQTQAKIESLLWFSDNSRGCCIQPIQKINLGPFITFPKIPNLIPFNYSTKSSLNLNENETLYLLIETIDLTNISESFLISENLHEVENYGELLAWKIDERLAIIMKTDTNKFSELVFTTFMQDSFAFNDNFQLIRAETVDIEGEAQDYEMVISHSRKDLLNRTKNFATVDQFKKHLEGIKSLGVLANQAFEFGYKKNLTEGKTGIVQPDLISSKNIEESLQNPVKSPETPKKTLLTNIEVKSSPMKVAFFSKKHESLDSPAKSVDSPSKTVRINLDPLPVSQESKVSPSRKAGILAKTEKIVSPQKEPLPASPKKIVPPVEAQEKPAPANVPEFKKRKTLSREERIELKDEKLDEKLEIKADVSNGLSTDKKVESPIDSAAKGDSQSTKNDVIDDKTESFLEKEKAASKSKIKSKPKLEPLTTSGSNIPSSSAPSKPLSNPPRNKKPSSQMFKKPPNILVYSDSVITRDNVMRTLSDILEENTYTIYPLIKKEIHEKVFLDNATLLVVCGSVSSDISDILLNFFLKGGKMLCLCSDLLNNVLPTYTTAEIRENELVQFSYGKWKNIKMMHHIFCYQPSPVRKHFSTESDDPPKMTTDRPVQVTLPRSVELVDLQGMKHMLQVQTLGTEETWQTPSLLLVSSAAGKIVFSQVHLEVDPSLYESDERKFEILKKNDGYRFEILTDLLSTHLNVNVRKNQMMPHNFSNGYFLGRHELKLELLEKLSEKMEPANFLKNNKIAMKFCGKNETAPHPESNLLPVMIHSCPEDFSTLDYFDILNTEKIGRLVIYSQVLTSSMHIIENQKYSHGFTVITRRQTAGKGRTNNQWLSPEGCLMFSMQLHIALQSTLGQRLALIQHIIATAIVNAILSQPGYQDLDIKIKWPNDLMAKTSNDKYIKIAGLIVNSQIEGDMAICNIGCGINLDNSTPTTCINDIIKNFNAKNLKQLPTLKYEKTFAHIFNELELIINQIQDKSDFQLFYDLYYKYWLHSDSSVTVKQKSTGEDRFGTIVGIDNYGFLKIEFDDTKQIETVHPDGNSFDMLRNLILPKF